MPIMRSCGLEQPERSNLISRVVPKVHPATLLPNFLRLSELRRAYGRESQTSKYSLVLTSSEEGWI